MRIFKISITAFLALFVMSASGCKQDKFPDLGDGLYAEIVTNKGTMVARLFHKKTPVTVANFVALAEGTHPLVSEEYKSKRFYDGLTFHLRLSLKEARPSFKLE